MHGHVGLRSRAERRAGELSILKSSFIISRFLQQKEKQVPQLFSPDPTGKGKIIFVNKNTSCFYNEVGKAVIVNIYQ